MEGYVPEGVNFTLRPAELATNATTGNDLLLWAASEYSQYDAFLQVSCTCPFLSEDTLKTCLGVLKHGRSCMTVKRMQEYWWSPDGKPLYDAKQMPNSCEMPAMYMETHGAYGVTRDELLETGIRFGKRPVFVEVTKVFEEFDINTPEDLAQARIIHAGMQHICKRN
jgi:CMP-N-acetylneuraminic acid synthetase